MNRFRSATVVLRMLTGTILSPDLKEWYLIRLADFLGYEFSKVLGVRP
jgi:hypothetical protein